MSVERRHPNARPGNRNASTHDATSEAVIRPIARNHRRRVLRQLRLSLRELDPIARGHLDAYCRLWAKIDLIDVYIAEHGLLRPDGEPQGCLKLYVSLQNSARLALQRLEEHLRARKYDPAAVLADYLARADGGEAA